MIRGRVIGLVIAASLGFFLLYRLSPAYPLGFLVGVLSSLSVVLWYETATRPHLTVTNDPDDPHCLDKPKRRCVYHVLVQQRDALWPFTSRRPAWATEARFEVYRDDRKTLLLPSLQGRWSSAPEPLLAQAQGSPIPDPSRIPEGLRADIHHGRPERLALVIQVEDRDWFVFNHLNYFADWWRYEPHRLQPGNYAINVQVFYESGSVDYWKEISIPALPQAEPLAVRGTRD